MKAFFYRHKLPVLSLSKLFMSLSQRTRDKFPLPVKSLSQRTRDRFPLPVMSLSQWTRDTKTPVMSLSQRTHDIRTYYTFLSLLFIALLSSASSIAQTVAFPIREMSTKLYAQDLSTTSPNVLRVANDARTTMLTSTGSFNSKVKYKSNHTIVKFSIDHGATTVPTSPFLYKLAYKIEGCPSTNDSVYSFTDIDTLVIGYNPDSLSAYQDVQIKVYPNLYQAKLTILHFYDITTGTPVSITPPLTYQNCFVELAMRYQPYEKTHYLPSDMGLNVTTSFDPTTQLLNVNWAHSTTPYLGTLSPAQYELEWTYVDNYAPDGTALSPYSVHYDFKNNATRILTDSLSYKIPIVYPKGYIAYRVRMIRVDSTIYRYPIYGFWSLPNVSGTIGSLSSASYYEITNPHSGDSLNWNYTIHFAEGGKYKHVVAYFDGMLKNRQTLTRFNAQPNLLLATENIYDYEGRPAITTLPTVINTNRFGYQTGVSISSVTNLPYAPIDFDVKPALCPDEVLIPAFKDSSWANRYYSRINTDTAGMQKFVPQAERYPFVHTQLSPGFSDRVDRMSGAGAALQISKGHDTRNEYLNADQPDLNNLFGINAGFSNFYTKTVTTDPNGQNSMTVKDYEGKQVLSSLVGASVDTMHEAIMFNDDAPNPASSREDRLATGIGNVTVGSEKRYSGSFYMDFAAGSTITYEYDFQPFTVCTSPYLGLTVKGSYDYALYDPCGVEKLHRYGDLGKTGVSTVADPPPAITTDMVSLQKGKHTINKVLTIADEEIDAAVDSFMAYKPSCLKTENEFIKEEVDKTQYPCPANDPCAALAKSMMEELFTDAKYGGRHGGFRMFDLPVTGTNPSIYDVQSVPGLDPSLHRYQAPCVADNLDTLVITNRYGTFTNISKIRADSFINYVYIGADRYKIAKVLLPLHPEYCKLLGCFIDTFETRFNAIPNAAIAQKYNFFDLDSIVKQDQQLRDKLTNIPFLKTHIDDSLRTRFMGLQRLDTVAAEIAFCVNQVAAIYGDAKTLFHSDIVNLNFPNNAVKDAYFQQLRSLYMGNREKYKTMALTAAGNTCTPCDTFIRMRLIPPPLVPVAYAADGSLATGPDSYLGMFSDTLKAKLSPYLGSPYISSTSALSGKADSVKSFVASTDSTLNHVAVDTVLARLVNCFSSTTARDRLKDTLLAMASRGEVHNGMFMPDQLRLALAKSGISTNDLCHPYLCSYDYYDEGTAAGRNCGPVTFFADAKKFFNDPAINAIVRSTNTTPTVYTPSAWPTMNSFADKIAAGIAGGSGSILVKATYQSDDSIYRFAFCQSGSTDTVLISFTTPAKIKIGATRYPYFYLPGAGTIDFKEVNCYYDEPSVYPDGYVAKYVFRASVKRSDFTSLDTISYTGALLAWSNATVPANQEGTNDIANCIPCTQFKTIFSDFKDSLISYGGYAVDHPLFFKAMRNFMNVSLKRVYTEAQYKNFFISCALADSMQIPMYAGYGKINFNSTSTYANIDDFVAAISASDDIDIRTELTYNTSSSNQYAIIDYRTIPYNKLKAFNDKLLAAGGVLKSAPASVIGTLWLPAGTSTAPLLSGTVYSLSSGTSVSMRTNPFTTDTESYTKYDVLATAASNADIASSAYLLDKNIYTNSIHAYWYPNRFATVNEDYYNPKKTGFLQYVYGMQSLPRFKVIDSLQAMYIKSNIPSFASSDVSYLDPNNAAHYTDMYYTDATSVYPQFDTLQHILAYAQAALGGHKIIIPNTSNTLKLTSGLPTGHLLNLYRCADGLYWYRYFGKDLQLFDVYIRVPQYIAPSFYPEMELLSIIPSTGDTSSKRFIAVLRIPSTNDTVNAYGSADFQLAHDAKLKDVLLGNESNTQLDETPLSGEPGAEANCEQRLLAQNIFQGKEKYQNYISKFYNNLRVAFRDHVMSQIKEKLWIEYMDARFGTTLYSYDLANNLIQTVPPAGIHKVDSATALKVDSLRKNNKVLAAAIPQHLKATTYEYNTFNKPYKENTPDAGTKLMFYDAKGNVLLSQSVKQRRKGGVYTYFLYDAQNRLNETGEVQWSDCAYFEPIKSYQYNGASLYHMDKPNPCACENLKDSLWEFCDPSVNLNFYDDAAFNAQIRSKSRSQVVFTTYDSAFIALDAKPGLSAQENLRSRIGANMYYLNCAPGMPGFAYEHATHYSYDAEGNVQTLTQDFPQLEGMNQRYKRIDYEYDLLSGKVNMISYNRGYPDQFYQRYSYDADNRLTKAETSHDGFIWKRDAEYSYYQHGPLARMSLGDQRVQGVDYAYTLQGWLKAINGAQIDTLIDMGGDGKRNTITPKDAFATMIDYFEDDYKPIGHTNISTLPATAKGLYNGNIARQTADVAKFGALVAAYTYDQMNRIRKANYASLPTTGGSLAFNSNYATAYRYDQDGNIKSLLRREGTGAVMDSMVYEYPSNTNNKLANVLDYASFSSPTVEDIKQYTTTGASRMLYDGDGNMVKDLSSNIDTLQWNIYGKATELHNNTSKLNLFFGYDALGHRTYKNQIKYTDTGRIEQSTFYVREASGNILAEYETMRQYSKGGIKDALKDIRGAVSAASAADVKHRWSMALDQLGYTTDEKFSAAIIAATGVHGTTRSTGYYLANDAGLTQQFVLGSASVMPAMAAYSAALNKYPVANALRMDLAAGDADIKLNNLSTALLGNPDTALQEHALLQLAETLPDIYAQVAQDNQLVISSSIDSIQLFNAMKYIANNNPAYFATQMFNAYQMEPTVIDNWLNAISSDTLYTNNTYYQANGFVGALQNSLLQFADDAATEEAMRSTGDPADKERFGLYGFGSWWPAGKSLLTSLSNSLDKVEYANDPIAVLDALPTYDVVDDAMEQLRDVDVEALADRMGVDYTAIAVSGTLTAPSLLQQSIALSSHHMYGSSRLGITRYWPTQYRHYWNYQSGIIDTLRLGMPSAWYSSALNDIIEAGHADPANLSTNTYNGVAHSMFAQHLLGQKQYELTNHLGNVQATLSDKRYVKTLSGNGTTATRDYFNAAIVAAYDYYPYGMLMPGRWTSDTDAHCSTLTLSQLVPHKTNTDLLGGTILSPSFSLIHGATALTAATGLGTTAGYTVYGSGGGVSKTLTVTSGVPIAINISIPYIYGSFITISVRETKAGVTSVLNTKNVTAAASYVLNVTPTTGTISIVVETMSSFAAAPSGGLFTLGYIGYEQVNYVPENVLVNLCSDNKDKYEFGYNTQMKVNEIAGIGNWNTAEFWEYNTRTGVRANMDPVFAPKETPYSVNHSNPVSVSDPKGDDGKSAAMVMFVTQEAAASAAGSLVLAPAIPFIELVGSVVALWELLKDNPPARSSGPTKKTAAPVRLMSKKAAERPYDDLPKTQEQLDKMKKDINRNSNGKPNKDQKSILEKIKTQEKLIKQRNAQKRNSN